MTATAKEKKAPAKKTYTAAELIKALETKYSLQNGYAFFTEITPGLGGGRRADGLAIGLYSSRGHYVYGFEVKVRRSDWLHELKDPAKAEAMFPYCNFWYLVAAPGVCNKEELPDGWGLLEPSTRGLRTAVKAVEKEARQMGVDFLSVILRRDCDRSKSYEWVPRSTFDEEVNKRTVEKLEWVETRHKREVAIQERQYSHLKEQFGRLRESVAEFERVTGVPISNRELPEFLKAARLLAVDGGVTFVSSLLDASKRNAETALQLLSNAADGIAKMREESDHA